MPDGSWWPPPTGSRGVVPLPKRRARKYSLAACRILERIWPLEGEPCGKYLAAIMGDALERFVRFKELGPGCALLDDVVRQELLSMSAATVDRHLAPERAKRYPAGSLSSSRPGTTLPSQIDVRWAATEMIQEPDSSRLIP